MAWGSRAALNRLARQQPVPCSQATWRCRAVARLKRAVVLWSLHRASTARHDRGGDARGAPPRESTSSAVRSAPLLAGQVSPALVHADYPAALPERTPGRSFHLPYVGVHLYCDLVDLQLCIAFARRQHPAATTGNAASRASAGTNGCDAWCATRMNAGEACARQPRLHRVALIEHERLRVRARPAAAVPPIAPSRRGRAAWFDAACLRRPLPLDAANANASMHACRFTMPCPLPRRPAPRVPRILPVSLIAGMRRAMQAASTPAKPFFDLPGHRGVSAISWSRLLERLIETFTKFALTSGVSAAVACFRDRIMPSDRWLGKRLRC